MNKIILFLIMLVVTMLFCSCFLTYPKTGNKRYDDRPSDSRFEQILSTFTNNDKEALKALFSSKALSEADDFDDHLDYVFDFFQGSVQSWNRTGYTSDDVITDGKQSLDIQSWYTVTTDKNKYRFSLVDYTVNFIDPDCVGLYSLCVINAADEVTQRSNIYGSNAGIYKPPEKDPQLDGWNALEKGIYRPPDD